MRELRYKAGRGTLQPCKGNTTINNLAVSNDGSCCSLDASICLSLHPSPAALSLSFSSDYPSSPLPQQSSASRSGSLAQMDNDAHLMSSICSSCHGYGTNRSN